MDPTLIAQGTAWGGFTRTSMKEAVLKTRGMTLDSATGRTVASATESTEMDAYLYRAIDDLFAKFPGLFNRRVYTVTWTASDSMAVLPANCVAVLAVTYGGLPVDALSREDYYRLRRTDEQGGGLDLSAQGGALYYDLPGFADNDAATTEGAQDYRMVIRLHPTPTEAKSLVVEYLCSAETVANAGDYVPLARPLQRWVIARACEMWSEDAGDGVLLSNQERERGKVEDTLYPLIDGLRPGARRATTRYPSVTRSRRFRR
jgi:hypothetical protein